MYLVKQQLIDSLLEAARIVYPNEFICLIGSKQNNQILDDLVVVPAVYGDSYSFIHSHLVPIDPTIKGSVHSHPTQSNQPSTADKQAFQKLGSVHLIIGYPYTIDCIQMYDSQGNPIHFEVIQ
ncbi:MAG: Mov34/MPN/PAD-1 family protein [Candidatus Diapherotrites archaeon]|nr:Mov34/MPN/PAD-1 family protein [Candidatus Diapherotrites archaeon]